MDKQERVARLMFSHKTVSNGNFLPPEWDELEPEVRQHWLSMAEAAIAALEPVTVQEAARVLLDRWIAGEFEDNADAVADDAITEQWAHVDRTFPDARPIIEAWLRALAERGE